MLSSSVYRARFCLGETWRRLVTATVAREEGQDMVEYALLVGLITLGTIAIIVLVGPSIKNLFENIVNGLGSA